MAVQTRALHVIEAHCETDGCPQPAALFWKVSDQIHWLPLCREHAQEIADQMPWCDTVVVAIIT